MGDSIEEINKHVKIYYRVFVSLVILTVVTVLATYLKVPFWLGIVIGLAIASLKGGLVAHFFMHLKWEKKMIHWIMWMTMFFFVVMMVLILGSEADIPKYPH